LTLASTVLPADLEIGLLDTDPDQMLLLPRVYVMREKLMEAIEQVERLCTWLDVQSLETHVKKRLLHRPKSE
jgi:hypothetical protein